MKLFTLTSSCRSGCNNVVDYVDSVSSENYSFTYGCMVGVLSTTCVVLLLQLHHSAGTVAIDKGLKTAD